MRSARLRLHRLLVRKRCTVKPSELREHASLLLFVVTISLVFQPKHDGTKGICYALAFRPDGTQLIAAVGSRVLMYNAADGDLLHSLKGEISYNNSAIYFYKKNSFQCMLRLRNFYYINGRHYDSYLYIYFVNGGRSRCSAIEILTSASDFVKSV
ncbi:unnamed protein product [Calypogeia fissa]